MGYGVDQWLAFVAALKKHFLKVRNRLASSLVAKETSTLKRDSLYQNVAPFNMRKNLTFTQAIVLRFLACFLFLSRV